MSVTTSRTAPIVPVIFHAEYGARTQDPGSGGLVHRSHDHDVRRRLRGGDEAAGVVPSWCGPATAPTPAGA